MVSPSRFMHSYSINFQRICHSLLGRQVAGCAAPLNRRAILVPTMSMDAMMIGMITGEWGYGQEGIVPDRFYSLIFGLCADRYTCFSS
jgi:hypothetical protein